MATNDEIEIALKVITEAAGDPTVGPIAELVKQLKDSSQAAKEVRVVEAKEKR